MEEKKPFEFANKLDWCPEVKGFIAYAVMCNNGALYKGYTANFKQRMLQHFNDRGCGYTKAHKPIYIHYYEAFDTSDEARKRERFFKTPEGNRWLREEGRGKAIASSPDLVYKTSSYVTGSQETKVVADKYIEILQSKIPLINSDKGACVFKIFYGDRYVVWRGKYLAFSLKLFIRNYAYFELNNHKVTEGKNELFYKMYDYIRSNPGLDFDVQVVSDSLEHLELLKTEYQLLQKGFKDKKNMNNNIEPYIPSKLKDGMYGWLSETTVDEFRSFVNE